MKMSIQSKINLIEKRLYEEKKFMNARDTNRTGYRRKVERDDDWVADYGRPGTSDIVTSPGGVRFDKRSGLYALPGSSEWKKGKP